MDEDKSPCQLNVQKPKYGIADGHFGKYSENGFEENSTWEMVKGG